MKKIKKFTAYILLLSMVIINTPSISAEWVHTENMHSNRNPLLMNNVEKNESKDRQLCKIASSFEILDDNGVVVDTYYPQGCQLNINNILDSYDNKFVDNTQVNNNVDSIDNFFEGLFGDNLGTKKYKNENSEDDLMSDFNVKDTENIDMVDNSDIKFINNYDEEINNTDFIDDIFKDKSSMSETNIDFSSASEKIEDINTETIENSENIDDLLKDIFSSGYIENKSLKGSKYAKTLRDYKNEKVRIRVGNIEANIYKDDLTYTSNVVNLLNKIDNELKIDSIKNSLANNISNVSYSLSTYKNTTDSETKEVFKNKLINDLKTLKKKYKILKNKDAMISATLEKRSQM